MGFKDLLRSSIFSAVGKSFKDDFNRADQTGLGGAWSILRSSFNISGNKASATTNNYPLASVTMPYSNVQIDLAGISEGAMAALWVSDAGNWWAVGIDQQAVNCNCSYYYNTYQYYAYNCIDGYNGSFCNASNSVCNATGKGSCKTSNNTCNARSYTCNGYSTACNGGYNSTFCVYSYYNSKNKSYTCVSYGGGNCKAFSKFCSSWSSTCNSSSSTCNAWNFVCNSSNYVCNGNFNTSYPNYYNCLNTDVNGPYLSCNTCYPQYIRIIQSVGSTVSTIASWTASQIIQSLRIKTSGSEIQIQAFSDTGFTSQVDGTLVHTPSGVAVTTNFGITVQPSQYQGYTIDGIEITKN
jgi:hypothetical protein